MATFVLIHGSCLGGWVWQRVAEPLRQAGHVVSTPTLTGLGERVHLARPEVDLDTHADDVVNHLAFEDLNEVVLVGHSYSGMVVSSVAERVPERLSHLVYLSACVPEDGQCVYDTTVPVFREIVEGQARERGDGWQWPMPPPEELDQYLTLDGFSAGDKAWVWSKAVPQPLGTYRQPLHLGKPAASTLPRTYVHGTLETVQPMVERVRAASGWDYRELPSGHWAMIRKPREVAALLVSLV